MTPLHQLASLATRKRLLAWGGGLLAVSWFIYVHTMMVPGLVDRIGRFKGSDYIQFYVMGSLVLDGRADSLYDPAVHLEAGRRRIVPDLRLHASHPNYGPQVALVFAPLALLPFGWSLAVFLALSIACYALSVWILWRECEALRPYGSVVAVLALASPVLFTVMRYGQASVFALVIWSAAFAALARRRDFLAGLCLGFLAYKPQLGILVGIAVLAARQWRVVAGAAAALAGQLAIGWAIAGSAAMARYAVTLWTLMLNPRLVQLHPSETHSLRGFVQLLVPQPSLVTVCSIVGLMIASVAAVRIWRSDAPLGLRWSALALLTILASPHLLTYDLLLLTLPLMALADWTIRHVQHPLRPGIAVLLVVLYFAPFSANIARVTGVQISVIVMMILAWRLFELCGGERRVSVRAQWFAFASHLH